VASPPRDQLQAVQESLKADGIAVDEARLDWVPKTPLDIEAGAALKVMNVVEQLEDLDDTQTVYSNLNITDDLIASFETAA
jgi:transcriptional/translational regulatory protein YebC/TACO1